MQWRAYYRKFGNLAEAIFTTTEQAVIAALARLTLLHTHPALGAPGGTLVRYEPKAQASLRAECGNAQQAHPGAHNGSSPPTR
eukprot:6209081-Pleurochrysis_carterae.AAC.1